VQGGGAFPNYDEITAVSKIDYFKATSDARPAYEGTVGGVPQSLLTAALMSAYVEPDTHMVRQITEGRDTIEVVPNRRLEDYLQRKVDDLLAAIDPNLQQQIEINVPSSEDVYIARVRRDGAAPPPAGTPIPPVPRRGIVPGPSAHRPSEGHEAAAAIVTSLSTRRSGDAGVDEALAPRDAAMESKVQKRLPDASIDHFESAMGFVIHGSTVVRAVASRRRADLRANVLTAGAGTQPGLVRVESAATFVVQRQDVVSVGVQLSDGRGVVLAGLPGYIGHVLFKEEGMTNISYIPSSLQQASDDEGRRRDRFEQYRQRREEIDRLRAMVALAVDRQTFRLGSEQAANALADRIRMSKSIDPTLGLYAAYAFSQAGNDEQVLSVLGYMREDLATDLFDVRLLANRQQWVRDDRTPVTPFCPMLTQGWSLLRPRKVALQPVLHDASAWLCGSLWTTFEPEGAKAILDAMEGGELQ
jgi:hypothetical protein